jgi:hypothetical protein
MAIGGLALSKPNFLSGNDSELIVGKYQQAALQLHGRALNTFSHRMATNVLEPRSTLLFTVLLAIFELMQGNPSTAGTVIARGFCLLGSHLSEAERKQIPATIHAYPSSGLENIGDLMHIWLRLPCMTCLLPFVPPGVRSDMIKATKSISSIPRWDCDIDEISQCWREVGVRHLQSRTYTQQSAQYGYDRDAEQSDSRSAELINMCLSWSDVLERRITTEKEPRILWSLRLMRVEQLNLLVFGDGSHRRLFSDAFKDLVLYCDNLLTESRYGAALKNRMTTYSGVLPLLSSIIQRCKYPDVRKLAVTTVENCYPAGVDYRTMVLKW